MSFLEKYTIYVTLIGGGFLLGYNDLSGIFAWIGVGVALLGYLLMDWWSS